jgi:hypothetical protein
MCTLRAFATAEFTCRTSVAAAGGDPTAVGAPDAVDPPPDGRRVEAAPELPPPQAATSSVAMIAATTAPQCRNFIFPPGKKTLQPVVEQDRHSRADGSS